MGRILAVLLGLLLIASVGSHAARAPEQYWKSALPNTPMPSSLSQLLNAPAGGTTVNVGPGGVHVDAGHGKPRGTTVDVGKGGVGVNVNPGSGKPGYGKPGGTTVGVGKGGVGVNVKPGSGKPAGGTTVGVGKGGVGVNVNPGHGKPSGTTVGVGKGGVGVNVNPGHGKPSGTTVGVGKGGVGVNVNPGYGKPGGTTVGVGKGGVGVNVKPGYGKPGGAGTTVGVGKGGVGVNVQPGYGKPGGTTVGVGKGGVGVHVNPRKKPVNVNVSPFVYNYAASETQLHDDPSVALFFQEKDLHAGKKMTLQFTNTTAGAKFLPRTEAEAIPFSSEKVPEILTRFSVSPDSVEAAEMAQTLHDCEAPAAKGEKKACATSLESMVDFATSSLGTSHVRAVSTVVAREGPSQRQEYTVTAVKRAAAGTDRLVACHAEPYAYAVFACHMTRATRAYSVSMLGKDGTAVEAVAVCHTDTAGWNPKHLAFQVLKVKPGTVPVCHFLPQDHVVWTRSG